MKSIIDEKMMIARNKKYPELVLGCFYKKHAEELSSSMARNRLTGFVFKGVCCNALIF